MSAHESMEHAEHAEHASGENKKIALLIAVIALFLALSETLGKGAQTEAISPPRRRRKSRSTTGRRPRRATAPSRKPAKARSNCPNAPSTPKRSAILPRQDTITTN